MIHFGTERQFVANMPTTLLKLIKGTHVMSGIADLASMLHFMQDMCPLGNCLKVPSHGTTFGSTCFATSCTTKRLRSTIQRNFTGYDDLRVWRYVAMVSTPKQ